MLCASCHQHRAVVDPESGVATAHLAKAGGSDSVAGSLLSAGNSGIGDRIERAAAASSSGPVCEAQMASSMAAGGGGGGMVRRSRRVNQARRPGGQIDCCPLTEKDKFQVGPSPGRCARGCGVGCGCCGQTLADGSTTHFSTPLDSAAACLLRRRALIRSPVTTSRESTRNTTTPGRASPKARYRSQTINVTIRQIYT